MRIFNTVGDVVTTRGVVKRMWREEGEGLLELEMRTEMSRGVSVGPGPVIVAEPEWLDVGFGEGVVSVSVGSGAGHDAVASVAIATAGPSGESAPVPAVLVDGRWTVSATGADRAMVRIDGRWVGRWFVR